MSMLHLVAGLMPKALTSIAFSTSTSANAQTVTCPSVQANDLLVLFDQALNGAGTPANAIPSGFTQLQTSGGSFTRVTLSYKVATGAESGSSLSGMVGDADTSKVLLMFRPNGVIQTVASSTFLEQTTDGNPSAQAIAASGQPAPLIRLGSAALGSTSFAPNFSAGVFDATIARNGASFGGIRAGYTVQNSSPSDDTPDLADNGSGNCLITGWLRFS